MTDCGPGPQLVPHNDASLWPVIHQRCCCFRGFGAPLYHKSHTNSSHLRLTMRMRNLINIQDKYAKLCIPPLFCYLNQRALFNLLCHSATFYQAGEKALISRQRDICHLAVWWQIKFWSLDSRRLQMKKVTLSGH